MLNYYKNTFKLYNLHTQISLTHVVGHAILKLQTEVVGTSIGVIAWKRDSKILNPKKEIE